MGKSISKIKELCDFGTRLAQERKRLDYSQSALAELLGKSSMTQFKYESGETRPDADYFFALNELGADIFYIITGQQLEALKESDERQLLSDFRALDERQKIIMLNLFHDMTQSEVVPNKKLAANKNTGKAKK